jgi:hypothetical protein
MNELLISEKKARDLAKKLIPYLPWQSYDVKEEYEAGEYIAAADGAIHDLGVLRTDLSDELISGIEDLIKTIRDENDAYSVNFLDHMITGFDQLKLRHELRKIG